MNAETQWALGSTSSLRPLRPRPSQAQRLYRVCAPIVFAGAGLTLGSATALADKEVSPPERVARANAALADGQFEEALEGYRHAEVQLPESPELAYNQAVAHYRLRDFAKAREMFSKALATRDRDLEARAKFNLGNCHYAEALEELSSLQDAVDKLRTAIEYYRDALDVAPEDTDARANIETAQLLIKDLLDKLKKQQEQQQQQEGGDQEQQDEQQQPEEGQAEDQQEQQGEQDQQEPDGEEQQSEEQQPEGRQGEDDPQGDQEQQQEQQPSGDQEEQRMTRDEAQRLLQAVRDKEQRRRDERARRRMLGRPRVAKDW